MPEARDGAPRVLVFASTYPGPDSAHRAAFLHRRALQLFRSGLNVTVITRHHITLGTYLSSWSRVWDHYSEPASFSYTWDGLPVYGFRLHLGAPLNYSRSAARVTYRSLLPRVLDLHRRTPFDIFYLATWGDFSLAAAWIAKELGIPVIASAIGGYENKYFDKPGTVPYDTMRKIFLNSDKVMCVSADLRRKVDLVTEGRAQTFVFYSGVDTAVFKRDAEGGQQVRREIGIGTKTRLLLFVGRIGPDKGIGELLEAYRRLRSRHSDLALALVGPVGNLRWLGRQLRLLDLEDAVHVLGPREPALIPGYMNAADVFAFPSWMEGLPNSVVEACACETAVVASRVGGVPEILQDGVSGLLVEPRDIEDLHGKLAILLCDVGLRRRLGRAGAERVAEYFDYERNAAVFASHFNEVVKKRGHSKSQAGGSAPAHGENTVLVSSQGKTGHDAND